MPHWRPERCRRVTPTRSPGRPTGWMPDERVELAAQAPSLVIQAATTSVDVFARRAADLARRDRTRRGPAPPREAALAADGAAVDGPRRHVPHPDQPRPRSRRPPVSRVRRRRRPRRRPSPTTAAPSTSSRPTRSWRWSPRRRSAGARHHAELLDAHRPRHAAQPASTTPACARPTTASPSHQQRSDGWPATPTSSRSCWTATAGSSTSDEPNAWPAADQRRALRAMHQTCAAPDCPVRFGDCDIHHLTEWRDGGLDQPREPDPAVLQAPPPHPRREVAPISSSTRRLTGWPPARPQAAGRPDPKPDPSPDLQELFDNNRNPGRRSATRQTPSRPGETAMS